MRSLFLSVLLMLPIWSSAAEQFDPDAAPERVIWRSVPVSVQLSLGKERRIHFPNTVQLGHQLPAEALEVLSVDGVVYITAKQDFRTSRVLVRDYPASAAGKTYILDLKVVPEGVDVPTLHIMLPDETAGLEQHQQQASQQLGPVTYETLTRYAMHRFYAPQRLWISDPRIQPVETRWPREKAVPLMRGGKLATYPLAAWRANDLYLTAFLVRNLTNQGVELNVAQDVRGQFLTATPQHGSVRASGSGADETVLYMISDRPFEEAMVGYLDWSEVGDEK